MDIGFIGAGKLGTSLGEYLINNGVKITGYFDVDSNAADDAASFNNVSVFTKISDLLEKSDFIFITVSDGKIGEIWNEIRVYNLNNKIICHTSGVMTSEIFSGIEETGAQGFSLHPMLAVNDKYDSYKLFKGAYFTLEGNGSKERVIMDLFHSFGNHICKIDVRNKIKYHAAGVCFSNFVLAIIKIGQDLFCECQLDSDFSQNAWNSLFKVNTDNIINYSLVDALTGPIERADIETIKKHLTVLNGDSGIIYKQLSKILVGIAKEKHPDRDYAEILEELK